MTDLRERVPAHALMEKLVSLRGTPDLVDWPFGIIKPSKDGMNWLRGATGELQMAARLDTLGPAWTVLHSVPVGERGSDIDHIAIGPSGVFPINTKRLIDQKVWVAGSRFLVNGRQRDYVRNAAHEALRIENVLRGAGIVVPIVPVIAISGAKRVTVKAPAAWDGRAIGVATVDGVVRRIRKRQHTVPPQQVARIAELFSAPSTWSRRPAVLSDAADVISAFDLIDRGIGRYRLMLIAALTVIVGGGAILAMVLTGALQQLLMVL